MDKKEEAMTRMVKVINGGTLKFAPVVQWELVEAVNTIYRTGQAEVYNKQVKDWIVSFGYEAKPHNLKRCWTIQ